MADHSMQTVTVPGTDLNLPTMVVGTMMFGKRADQAESRRIVDLALDSGLTFFDTADMYQFGESERILGRALGSRRDGCLIASKVGYGHNPAGEEEGLSREAILSAADRSLRDLGTDWIDIYYLHRPDHRVPVEESLAAVMELIDCGKIRHFAISNYSAWQSLRILNLCDANGWPRPVMTQMIYNALVRQIEFEYVSFCRTHDLHLTVYNPLAGGLLTGKYASLADEGAGARFRDNPMYRTRYWSERFFQGMLGLKRIADEAGASLTHLALNWVVQGGNVDSVLLGPSSAAQLQDCLAAMQHPLSEATMDRIRAFLLEWEGTNATYAR